MLDLGVLDEGGYLSDGKQTLRDSVDISQSDVRMLQLAKSAICAGVQTLTEQAGIDLSDLSAAFIAGGFGNYLNMQSAEQIGLLPSSVAKKAVTVGNAALVGASMLLLDADQKDICERMAKSAYTL